MAWFGQVRYGNLWFGVVGFCVVWLGEVGYGPLFCLFVPNTNLTNTLDKHWKIHKITTILLA